jgi:hypothetical protein
MCPRAGLDGCENPAPTEIRSPDRPAVAVRYTDYATPADSATGYYWNMRLGRHQSRSRQYEEQNKNLLLLPEFEPRNEVHETVDEDKG